MFRRFAEFVLLLKWPLLLGILLITLINGNALFRLQIDPSTDTLFAKNSAEFKYYREYNEQYGSDQMIAIAMATGDLFTLPMLRRLDVLTKKIAAFPQVERVLSLANAMDIRHKFLGVKIEPVMKDVFEGEKSLSDLRTQVLDNELYRNNLISRDGRIANILVHLTSLKRDRESNGAFIEKIRKMLKELERPDIQFYMAGAPVEQYDFIKLIRRDQLTFVPMITALLILTTILIYQSFACMILSMSIVFVTLVWSMGTISLLGKELNLVTSLLAPVIMICSVASSIHLMNLFFEIRPHHPSLRKAVVLTMEQLGIPSFLTYFTTIFGFASLAVSPIPAIQSFGIFAALGTLYSYIVEMFLTPILLPILPYRRTSDSFDERHFFNRILIGFLEELEYRWKWWILIGTAVVVLLSFKGIAMLEVDTNIVKQLKPDSPLAVSTRFIDEHLTGVYPLGFVLRRRDGGTVMDYETLVRIDNLKDFLESRPEIAKVNSITTVIKKIHQAVENNAGAYEIPRDQGRLERYFKGFYESQDPELWKLITPDLKEVRLEARMRAVGTRGGAHLEAVARAYLEEELGKYFQYHLTGNVVLLGRMAKDLVTNQMNSFGFSFLSILAVIVVAFRSFRMGLLAVIPNIVPILAIYGLMGLMRVELSTPTAMISSIVLGLVVDASIYFLHRFEYEFQRRHHYLQALHHTYRNVGQALVVATMILMAGFASSIFASFRPTIHFGVLTSLTIFFALVCTLVVLPVCLVMFKPFGPQRLFKEKQPGFKIPHSEPPETPSPLH